MQIRSQINHVIILKLLVELNKLFDAGFLDHVIAWVLPQKILSCERMTKFSHCDYRVGQD